MPRTSKKQVYMGKLLDSGDLAYTECVTCPDRDVTCKGPNLSVLDSDSYRAWVLLLMEELGWSHADLSDASGVAKSTIDNWLAGHAADVRRDTSWRIARALFGNREVCAPCPLKAQGVRELNAKAAAYDELKQRYDALAASQDSALAAEQRKIDHLKEQVAFQKDQLLAKDNLLNERRDFLRLKDRAITILSIALAVAVLALISIFVVDLINPNIGFFWVK